jgi:hypothetical protein
MIEVYNGPLEDRELLKVKLLAGTVRIEPGKPHLVAEVNEDPRGDVKLDASKDWSSITGHGCNLVINYQKEASLNLEMESGVADIIGMSPRKSFAIKAESCTVKIMLNKLSKASINAAISSGILKGSMQYSSENVDSKVSLAAASGVLDVRFGLPTGVAFKSVVDGKGASGVMRFPQELEGKRGLVKLYAKPGSGIFILDASRVK